MSYRFVKENDGKVINTETVDVEHGDDFIIDKNVFRENPENFKVDEQLGEDFLVSRETRIDSDDDDMIQQDIEDDNESDDVFLNEAKVYQREEMSYEDMQQQKSHYLYQLNRLKKRGFESSRRFGMEHPLEEIRGEVFRLKKEIDMDNSIDYCRQGLMFCVSTVEMLNGQYKLGGNLNGWSQAIMGNIDSYDEIFEELYEKYYTSVKMAPEIKLISMVAGSAFMFHLQKSLLNNETMAPRQREMSGPSINTDELLKELNDEVMLDDISSIASSEKSVKLVVEEERKSIPLKRKVGRQPKAKKI